MDANSIVVAREVSGYWLEPEIISAVITGFSILIVAFVGYFFGLRTFFRKRKHELILKRYLEEGIDRLAEAVDEALRVFMMNNLTASIIVKQAKYSGKANLPDKFDKFERRHLTLIPFYKIRYLVGDGIFTKSAQIVWGFVDGYETILDTDFRSELANMPNEQRQREELLERLDKQCEEAFKKSVRYTRVLRELQSIASILERETTLTWIELGKFKNRPEVKESVERLKERFTKLEGTNSTADKKQ